MTPKGKAFSLFAEYASRLNDGRIAKRCAIIAVDEILKVVSFYNDTQAEITYWQEVKQEIKNL